MLGTVVEVVLTGSNDKVRVDKWLWAARCFKTRSQASAACDGGLVKINDETAKASKPVKVGDTVAARTPGGPRVLVVKGLADRRGPAKAARELYEDHSPEPPPRVPDFEWRQRGAGRPTKRDRRRILRIKGREQ